MYWILKTKLIEWNNKLRIAEIINNPREPLQRPEWWGNEIIPDPKPEFEFRINPRPPHVDNYATGTIYKLFSDRLISIISTNKVACETYTTYLFDEVTGDQLPNTHNVFRLLEMHDVIDKGKTVFENREVRGIRDDWIKKLVLDQAFIDLHIQMTRVSTNKNMVIIHDELKKIFEANNIIGFEYQSVSDYISPMLLPLLDTQK